MEKIRIMILWVLSPLIKLAAKIKKPEPKMTEYEVDRILSKVQPGDLLFCNESLHLTNWLIPSDFDHVGIVYRGQYRLYVIEAVAAGVVRVPLRQWLFQKDKVAVGRDKKKTKEDRVKAGKWANSMVGILSYDTTFQMLPKIKKVTTTTAKKLLKTYCARLCCDALDLKYQGIIEPIELMKHPEIKIIYSTEKKI